MSGGSGLKEIMGLKESGRVSRHCSALCPCRDTRQEGSGMGKDGQCGSISSQGLALATSSLCPVDRYNTQKTKMRRQDNKGWAYGQS